MKEIQHLKRPLAIKSWNVFIPNVDNTEYVKGRLCIIRKTEEAINISHKKLKRHASKKGIELKAETLIYAKYVIVFTTFPENQFTAFDILEWYRIRWQIELVFKRFKQIAQFGHLPKYDDDSSKAWLYGKLFVALLTEKLIDFATSFPPGDTSLSIKKTKSKWREFAFMFNQVKRAIEPALSLQEVLKYWNDIACSLAENIRIRKTQISKYFDCT